MKPTTLSPEEFAAMIDAMLAAAERELGAAKARMDSLRSGTLPPG